jgi:hypothetical protein
MESLHTARLPPVGVPQMPGAFMWTQKIASALLCAEAVFSYAVQTSLSK